MDGGFVPHSAADWQAALPELKREGRELVGPCPMPDCGGEDRFHVNNEGVIGCRGCIDGRPEDERKRRFGEIVRHVFGEPERGRMNGSAAPTRTFIYCRPDATPYHRVYRQGDGEGKRCWQDKDHKGQFFPYRIEHAPDWEDKPVVVVEGEKCADHLATLGYASVTWCGGTNKVTRTRWGALAGRDAILWPDHDAPGLKAMQQLAEILDGLGCAVRWVSVPEGKPGGWDCADATDDEIHRLIAEAVLRPPIERDGDETTFVPTMSEFLAAEIPPMEWLVDGLLPAAGLAILAAKPKVGKSTTTRSLAVAIARGETFLARRTKQGAVFYGGFEEEPSFAKAHFQTMGVTAADPIYPFVRPAPDDFLERLESWIADIRPALVVLDPLAHVAKVKDENAYMEMQGALKPLAALARAYRTSVLICHHNKKADASDFGDEILGSTAIRANVDTTLHMARNGDQRILRSEQRYGTDMPQTVLHLDPVTERIEAGGTVVEAAAGAMEQDILDTIAEHGEPMRKGKVEEAVKGKAAHIRKALDRLCEQGRLDSWPKGNSIMYQVSSSSPP